MDPNQHFAGLRFRHGTIFEDGRRFGFPNDGCFHDSPV
jgi:hypothetical protein